MALNLELSKTKGIAVVRCRGRIVFGEEADELRRVILNSLKETKGIVLDFAWVEFIDSTGIGVLVGSLISARHRGAEIKIAALGRKARQVLTTANVDGLFEIHDSADAAVTSFLRQPEAAAG